MASPGFEALTATLDCFRLPPADRSAPRLAFYLAEAERQHDLPAGSLLVPKLWLRANRQDIARVSDPYPRLFVYSPGLSGVERHSRVSYSNTFDVQSYVQFQALTDAQNMTATIAYAWAMRHCVIETGLPLADDVEVLDERYSENADENNRMLGTAAVAFNVKITDELRTSGGTFPGGFPEEPTDPAPDSPVIGHVEIDVFGNPLV